MALPEEKKPVYDEKVKYVLEQLKKGNSRAEIADDLDYSSYKSMDMYLRRKNFRWNADEEIYEPKHTSTGTRSVKNFNSDSKAELIIQLMESEDQDPKKVAQQVGFNDHLKLAKFMERKGYTWSSDRRNYIKKQAAEVSESESKEDDDTSQTEEPEPAEPQTQHSKLENQMLLAKKIARYEPMLDYLEENWEQLEALVEQEGNGSDGEIPRYAVPGTTKTKSVYMADSLANLVTEFSKSKNIKQRDIFEAAVIEYLRKYGYVDAVDSIL